MQNYQRAFIEFAIEREVLRFGQYTLKSGRLGSSLSGPALLADPVCMAYP